MSSKSSHLSRVGATYLHFKVTKHLEIPELQCLLTELVHEPTGALCLHIGNTDPENLFCLSFRTLPHSSNGAPHILEHTVLCGSQKFPVKDPFFAMNRRSLNTFMNALTGLDFTCYPAASQIPQDFYNLLEVYLDAVFHPSLKEFSFLQEGHRLEFAIPSDPTSPLEYKGIVYNEMKGVLSSTDSRLSDAMHEALFKDTPYRFNSGGTPSEIPKLSYEELKEFYHQFYHPSRCLFFFYGSFPLEKHLEFISKQTLDHANALPSLPPIPLQPRFKQPLYLEKSYPLSLSEKSQQKDKAWIAFGWLTCTIVEQSEVLALSVLEILLTHTDASPLKRAFLESGLCKQVTLFGDNELSEIPWGIVLKGCHPESADALEKILKETLSSISSKEIPLELIENALHQLEFYRSEITGDHTPFGLSLFMRSGLLKQHGVEPEKGLCIHSLFDALRQKILTDPHYLNHFLKKYFLENTHFVRIVLKPDPTLAEKESAEEKTILENIKARLNETQKQDLVERAQKLSAFQKEQERENVDVLPKLSLNDVPAISTRYPLKKESWQNASIFYHNTFTNGITYADVVFDLPQIREEDLPYLRLFTIVLPQIGCGGRTYLETLDYIQAHTGGISAGINLNVQANNFHAFFPSFHLRGKALDHKVQKLFPLLKDFLMRADFSSRKRLKEIILKHFTAMENRLTQSALKYALNLASSHLTKASKAANALYGLRYYLEMRKIAKNFDQEAPHLIAKLQELQEKLFHWNYPHLLLGCEAKTQDKLKSHQFYDLLHAEAEPFHPWTEDVALSSDPFSEGRIISSSVAFISQVFPSIPYTHPSAPALHLAALLFDNLVLHRLIREQGGAYGGGAASNPMSGNFYFYSYSDPNITKTLDAFQEAVALVASGKFEEEDIQEGQFEAIQILDSPISPGYRAELAYTWYREGKTEEIRQRFRQKILKIKKEEIVEAVKEYLIPQMKQGSTVVFSSKEQLERANQELKEPLVLKDI